MSLQDIATLFVSLTTIAFLIGTSVGLLAVVFGSSEKI